MKETIILTAAFPDRADQIDALRRTDDEFDEICSDFAALSCLAGSAASSGETDDIRESLAELKREIENALYADGRAKHPKEGRMT